VPRRRCAGARIFRGGYRSYIRLSSETRDRATRDGTMMLPTIGPRAEQVPLQKMEGRNAGALSHNARRCVSGDPPDRQPRRRPLKLIAAMPDTRCDGPDLPLPVIILNDRRLTVIRGFDD
jgi:hypothetical protein